jgi:hypothetical protein
MFTIKILPASYYQSIFNNNLQICGVEDRMPLLLGNKVDMANFFDETNND